MSHLRNGKVGMLPGDDRMTGTGEQVERSGARSQWNGLNTRICSSPRDGAKENEVWLRCQSFRLPLGAEMVDTEVRIFLWPSRSHCGHCSHGHGLLDYL